MPVPDRRTIGELLADSDALARDTLLDARPENAPAMVRSWNQLVASAAHLWAALSSPPDDKSKSATIEGLRLVGEARNRSGDGTKLESAGCVGGPAMGSAVVAALYVGIGHDGRPAACRGGDRSQRSRRALARARTDRRSPDRDC